jgi:hypothetical protein
LLRIFPDYILHLNNRNLLEHFLACPERETSADGIAMNIRHVNWDYDPLQEMKGVLPEHGFQLR